MSPAQQVDTASGRGLTPRNPHQTPMESVPPNKWTRQAAGDLHPETPTKPPPNPHGISPAQQVDTASGRGLTPRNPHQTPTKPPWNQSRPTSGHGKRQGTYTQKPAENLQKTPW